MKIVSEKKSYFQKYFGDSKFGMEVDLIETIQKSYILHVRTLKTELGKAPKASARGSPRRSDARSYVQKVGLITRGIKWGYNGVDL